MEEQLQHLKKELEAERRRRLSEQLRAIIEGARLPAPLVLFDSPAVCGQTDTSLLLNAPRCFIAAFCTLALMLPVCLAHIGCNASAATSLLRTCHITSSMLEAGCRYPWCWWYQTVERWWRPRPVFSW